MNLDLGSLVAHMRLDNAQFLKPMAQAEQQIKKTTTTTQALATTMTRAFAVAGVSMGLYSLTRAIKSVTSATMSAVESENLFNVSMGESAEKTRAWSESLAESLRLNPYLVRQNVGTFNVMFESLEVGSEQAVKMSESLVQLAEDMASFYNLRSEDAFVKLQAGISGEIEPLRRLGIIINETKVKQELLNMGLRDATREASEAEKAIARYNIILRGTEKAQGDLERTLESGANKTRAFRSEWSQFKVEFGKLIEPTMTTWVGRLTDAVKSLRTATEELSQSLDSQYSVSSWTRGMSELSAPAQVKAEKYLQELKAERERQKYMQEQFRITENAERRRRGMEEIVKFAHPLQEQRALAQMQELAIKRAKSWERAAAGQERIAKQIEAQVFMRELGGGHTYAPDSVTQGVSGWMEDAKRREEAMMQGFWSRADFELQFDQQQTKQPQFPLSSPIDYDRATEEIMRSFASRDPERLMLERAQAYRAMAEGMVTDSRVSWRARKRIMEEEHERYKEIMGENSEIVRAWHEEQVRLFEEEGGRLSDSWAAGMRSFASEAERTFKTAGQKGYEFAKSMESAIANGLEGMTRDVDNWKEHLLSTFEEILHAAVRIAFIQPAAQALAGGFASAFGGTPAPAYSKPTYPAHAEGGLVTRPHFGLVGEAGPELILPLDKVDMLRGAGMVTVNVNNESGVGLAVSKQDEYILSDKRIIDVTVRAAGTSGPYRRAHNLR